MNLNVQHSEKPKQDFLPLGQITPEDLSAFNKEQVQGNKPEDQKQTSYEKLGVQEWEVKKISGRELVALQYYVETTGQGVQAYNLWKELGHHVTIKDLMEELNTRQDEVPENVRSFVRDITTEFDAEQVEEKIKTGDIYPPLIVYPIFNGKELKDLGLLKLGNIVDGTHRIFEVAKWLSAQSQEDINNFELTIVVGHIPLYKYFAFQAAYLGKAWKTKEQAKRRQENGITEGVKPEDVMDFFETWHLLLQRIGFKG